MAENRASGPSRRQFLAFGGTATSALLLAACSGGGGAGGSGSGAPRQGGAITQAGLFGVNTSLDVHETWDPATLGYIAPVYSKLVDFKTGPGVRGAEVVPDLARDWEISGDGLTYTFHLRDNVVWHDVPPVNGRPFTADDVVATITRIKEQALQAWQFAAVTDVQPRDDHTVVFKLSEPFGPLLTYLAYSMNVIFPREGVDGQFDLKEQAIGTGPFVVEQWERDEEWVRVRNPNYFIKGRPYLDELNTVIIPESSAIAAALRSQRIDVGFFSDLGMVDELVQEPHLKKIEVPGSPFGLYLNQEEAPFDDLRVRRAVAMAIDFDRLGELVWGEYQLSCVIPPVGGKSVLSPDEIREVRPHDPNRAKQLLAEAGHPDGFETELLAQEVNPTDVRAAEFIVQELKEIGIQAKIQVTDPSTAIERRRDGAFTMHTSLHSAQINDFFLNEFDSESLENYSNVNDTRLEGMVKESRRLTDEAAYTEKVAEIARYMEENVSSVIYGVSTTNFFVYNTRVHNLYPHQLGGGRGSVEFWVDE